MGVWCAMSQHACSRGTAHLHHRSSASDVLGVMLLFQMLQAVLLMSMGGRLGRKLMGIIPVTLVYLCNIMYGMAVLVNLLGCLWLFTARCEGLDQSWLVSVGMLPCSLPPSGWPSMARTPASGHLHMCHCAWPGSQRAAARCRRLWLQLMG